MVARKHEEFSCFEKLKFTFLTMYLCDYGDVPTSCPRLRDPVLSELETALSQMDQQSKEVNNLKRDLEFSETEKSKKLKDLEKQLKASKIEKEDFARDLTEAQEKLKLQSKELKDAVQQRKLAMSEYTEVTDK